MTSPKKIRVMVDMSATLIHQGHTRLLKKAREMGDVVIVALTTDEEIKKWKGYDPELSFEERREVLLAMRDVDEVVPSPWKLDEAYVQKHQADFLLHAGPNFNEVVSVKIVSRTEGVSSSELRSRSLRATIEMQNSQKALLTPGPTNLRPENVLGIRPLFGRGDKEYEGLEEKVLKAVKKLAGQDSIARLQGSATTALDVATHNFLYGDVLAVVSGYYSQRLFEMVSAKAQEIGLSSIRMISYEDFIQSKNLPVKADWILFSYAETANGFLADMPLMSSMAKNLGAKLLNDATASINLEKDHELSDINVFSSCKGLGGLTGAGFITFNEELLAKVASRSRPFVLDLQTYLQKKTTGPYHALASMELYCENFAGLGDRVRLSKKKFIERFKNYIPEPYKNQPALCTRLEGVEILYPENFVPYQSRLQKKGSAVICHLLDLAPSNREIGAVYEQFEVRPC